MDLAIAEHLEAGLDPDLTPPEIIGDINVSPALACRKQEILDAANVRLHLAQASQYRIKQANDRIEKYAMEGIGARVASIDRDMFAALCLLYGRRWFRDRKTLHEVLDRHPELSVRYNLRKFSVRVDGLKKAESGKRKAEITISRVGGRGMQGDPAASLSPVREAGECFDHESPPHANSDSRRLDPPSSRLRRGSSGTGGAGE